MNFLFSVVLLLESQQAFATNKVGNGGNVVICKSKAQILDFYENGVEEPTSNSTSKDKAEKIVENQIGKLKTIAPELHAQYRQRLQTIVSEFDFKEDVRLIDTKDSHHSFVPASKDCEVVQTIIRKNTVTEEEKRFLVDKKTWNKISTYQQAGLVLHEIIYEHFSKLGEKDSIKARKLNAFIFKNEPTQKSFWEFIKNLDIAIYP